MKKLGTKKGMTLAEMLIAVLLLAFVAMMCTAMTSVVLNTTSAMQDAAQAEILGNEALENLEKELRFAKNLRFDGDRAVFDSAAFDSGCSPALNDEGKIRMNAKGDLLFAGSAYGDLRISDLRIYRAADGKSVVLSLAVAHGTHVLWENTVTVKPVNGIPGAGAK